MEERRGRIRPLVGPSAGKYSSEYFSPFRDVPTVRGIIAVVFVCIFAFFVFSSIILSGISLFVPLEGKVAEAKEIILTISGVFSGPLGLIIGYYFRAEVDRKKD